MDFDFELQKNGFRLRAAGAFDQKSTGVFGPSGSGKTTLLHLLAGLERPDRGHFKLNDRLLFDDRIRLDTPAYRRRIAVVFQEGRLFPHFSVAANLRFGERRAPPGRRKLPFGDVAALLELEPLLSRRPAELSGGEAQRVALGRALLSSPELLLLDEPLASLDARLKKQILPFLRRIRDTVEIPMIYISHDLGELLQLTDRLLLLENGDAVGYGPFLELAQSPRALDLMSHIGMVNVLPLTVRGHQSQEGVSTLTPAGAATALTWTGPCLETPVGGQVYAALRPEDIALVKQPVADISIQNQIEGELVNIIESPGGSFCLVRAGVDLLAEITPFAAHRLSLTKGQRIWCLFKARALRYLD